MTFEIIIVHVQLVKVTFSKNLKIYTTNMLKRMMDLFLNNVNSRNLNFENINIKIKRKGI